MTLITQFKNNSLSFIAGDGVSNFNSETGRFHKNHFDKVYKCYNVIVGLFGKVDHELIKWLNETYKKYNEDEVQNELLKFFCEIKIKHISDIDKPSCEGVNLIHSSNNFFFLLSTKQDNDNLIVPLKNPCNINKNKYTLITKKEYFFSPQTQKDSNEIDIEHQTLLENLFKQSFKEIYLKEYEKEEIQNDSNLFELIELFYSKVYADSNAHKKCINGRVSYSVLSNNIASEIRYINFELSSDFPTRLTPY